MSLNLPRGFQEWVRTVFREMHQAWGHEAIRGKMDVLIDSPREAVTPGGATPKVRLSMLPQYTFSHYRNAPAPIRFWAKVNFTDTCWLWLGTLSPYGKFRAVSRTAKVGAHRWAYEFCVGPIPKGLTLDHLCRTPACVNPDHLEPVTQRVNNLRGTGMTARNAAKTHCKRGHPFNEANTYYRLNGTRECRGCHCEEEARRRSRRRLEICR